MYSKINATEIQVPTNHKIILAASMFFTPLKEHKPSPIKYIPPDTAWFNNYILWKDYLVPTRSIPVESSLNLFAVHPHIPYPKVECSYCI